MTRCKARRGRSARAARLLLAAPLALCAALFLRGCPTPEPPRTIALRGNVNVPGTVTLDGGGTFNYSGYKAVKVHLYKEKPQTYLGGAEVGDSGEWSMDARCESGERAVFWVELRYKNTAYFNAGETDVLSDDMRRDIYVTPSEVDGKVVGAWLPLRGAADLALLGKDPRHPLDGNYVVVTDIDIRAPWVPVGAEGGGNAFTGILYGRRNAFRISGLSGGADLYTGVFGRISGGVVYDLGLDARGVNIALDTRNGQAAGLLAGCVEGDAVIRGIEVTGNGEGFTARRSGPSECYMGGVAGILRGGARIYNSNISLNLTLTVSTPSLTAYCGGVAGVIGEYARAYQCSARGTVAVSNEGGGGAAAGGISGGIHPSAVLSAGAPHIENSYSLSGISASGGDVYAGGIAGYSGAPAYIEKCYTAGGGINAVSLSGGVYAAGILGYAGPPAPGAPKNEIRGCAVFAQAVSAETPPPNAAFAFVTRVTRAPCPDCATPPAPCPGMCGCANPSVILENNVAQEAVRLSLNGAAPPPHEPCNDGLTLLAITAANLPAWDFNDIWLWSVPYPELRQR